MPSFKAIAGDIHKAKSATMQIQSVKLYQVRDIIVLSQRGHAEIGNIYYRDRLVKRIEIQEAYGKDTYTVTWVREGTEETHNLVADAPIEIEVNIIEAHPDLSYFNQVQIKKLSDEAIAKNIQEEVTKDNEKSESIEDDIFY